MIGTTLLHYRIVEKLGEGGMGVVYKARDTHLERFVALKILPSEWVAHAGRLERFVQEARCASALNHPNIVTIHDIASDGDRHFIAMEYVSGHTLDELTPRRGMRLAEVLKVAVQIADALARAHAAGIVHRDLKPANVMVDEHGLVKVLDFGLAKLRDPVGSDETSSTATVMGGDKPITEQGAILGTAAYMSPEQAEGRLVDARSDIFSFGSLLYEMLTGRRAFPGDSKIAILSAILGKEPAPLGADVPRDLEKVVTRCLRKDPQRRFQHMEDLKVALDELKEESDSGKLTALFPAPSTGGVWLRRPTLVAAVVLAAALGAGLGALGWLYLRPASKTGGDARERDAVPAGRLTMLLSSQGQVSDPALSPDGKMIAYVAEDEGREDLFVGRVAGGGRVRLTSDQARERRPEFSPDGERIAFTRVRSETGNPEIWVVPTLGGQAVRLQPDALDATWSPDGRQLAFVRRQPGEGDTLVTSGTDGTHLVSLLHSDGDYPGIRHPAWSPDGSQLAVVRSMGGHSAELWLVPVSGGAPRRLLDDPPGVSSDQPSFNADGGGIVHQSNRAGATNLWSLPLDGRPLTRLTTGPGPDESPSVARDGRIAFVNSRSRCSLVVSFLSGGRPREVLSHPDFAWSPAFSPTGDELAISLGSRDGSWHVWVVPVRGGSARQLTSGSLPEMYARFTPDGRSVLFNTWSPGPDRIWRAPLDGGPPIALTPAREEDDAFADPSPDGMSLAFSRTEKGIPRIYVAPLAGGEARRLTNSASTLPRWSPDGRWIAFGVDRALASGVYVIGSDGAGARRLADVGGWPVWFPDGKRVAFLAVGPDGYEEVRVVPFTGGPARLLPGIHIRGANNPFDLSPDGSLLATSTCTDTSSEVWLLTPGR